MGSFWTAPLKFTTTVRNGSSAPLPPCMALSPAADFFCSTWIVSCTQGGATRASGVRTCMRYLQQVFSLVPCGERRVLSGTSTYSTLFTTSRPVKASNFASEITEMPETPPRKEKKKESIREYESKKFERETLVLKARSSTMLFLRHCDGASTQTSTSLQDRSQS